MEKDLLNISPHRKNELRTIGDIRSSTLVRREPTIINIDQHYHLPSSAHANAVCESTESVIQIVCSPDRHVPAQPRHARLNV